MLCEEEQKEKRWQVHELLGVDSGEAEDEFEMF
jgi:hypothetical protein